MKKFQYSSNNSGGNWWLTDEDWLKLEKAGWEVDWYKNQDQSKKIFKATGDRWLGALATYATKDFPNEAEAIADFEIITGQDYYDEGCNCCGNPHYISEA